MIRVWGGGTYEDESFYSACDELGIMVWQDFMFGCGQYPAYQAFLDNVKVEAEQAVKRLRHHPSIVVFAGNNEGDRSPLHVKPVQFLTRSYIDRLHSRGVSGQHSSSRSKGDLRRHTAGDGC